MQLFHTRMTRYRVLLFAAVASYLDVSQGEVFRWAPGFGLSGIWFRSRRLGPGPEFRSQFDTRGLNHRHKERIECWGTGGNDSNPNLDTAFLLSPCSKKVLLGIFTYSIHKLNNTPSQAGSVVMPLIFGIRNTLGMHASNPKPKSKTFRTF